MSGLPPAGMRCRVSRTARPRPARRSWPGAVARAASRQGGRARRVGGGVRVPRRPKASRPLRPRRPRSGGDPAWAPGNDVWGRRVGREEGLACGDRVGLELPQRGPESSPIKGTFSGLSDSRFTLPPPVTLQNWREESTSPLKKTPPA